MDEISFKAGYEAHKAELCGNCDTPLLREGELYQKLDESKKVGRMEVVEWLKEAKCSPSIFGLITNRPSNVLRIKAQLLEALIHELEGWRIEEG